MPRRRRHPHLPARWHLLHARRRRAPPRLARPGHAQRHVHERRGRLCVVRHVARPAALALLLLLLELLLLRVLLRVLMLE